MRTARIPALVGYFCAAASLLYLLGSLIIYAVPALDEWRPLAFAPVRRLAMLQPPFADMAMLTHTAGCDANLRDLYAGSVNCDPYGRLFTYPPMALWPFRLAGLTSPSLGWMGGLTGAAVAGVLGVLFFRIIPSPLVAGVSLSLAYLSLPLMLALERANNDLIVFLLLTLLSLTLVRDRPRWRAASGMLALLAVATKILPFFGIVTTAFLPPGGGRTGARTWANRRWALLGGLAGLALVIPWLEPVLRNSPTPPGGILSHGLLALQFCYDLMGRLQLGLPLSRLLLLGCVGLKLLALLIGGFAALRCGLATSLRRFLEASDPPTDAALLAGVVPLFTATWLGSYLVTRSYDYKFIFLLPVFAVAAALLCQPAPGPARAAMDPAGAAWLVLILVPMLSAWFVPYLAVSFNLPVGVRLELVNDFLLVPLLAGALAGCLLGGHLPLRQPA